MNRPFPAYRGDEPFVFISYSHRDSELVYQQIVWLHELGFNIWYDEGIEAGREWREEIATAISTSRLLIYFVTENSVGSENCRNEVNFAADEQVPILTVYLSPTDLPGGLRLTLSNRQAIKWFELGSDEYTNKLLVCLENYLGTGGHADASAVPQPPLTTGKSEAKSRRLSRFWLTLGVVLIPFWIWLALVVLPEAAQDSGAIDLSQSEARLRSIAVLPLQNLSDSEHDAVADGIALDLVTGLSKIHAIRVAASTSSFAYKGQYQDVGQIGRQLRVDTVLEGSVRIVDNQARVTARLLLVEDGYQLWSERYDVTFDNVLALQDQITAEILDAVRLHLIDQEQQQDGEILQGAYNLYLLARDNMRARTEPRLKLAKQQFEQSLALDPEFAPAWSDLARTNILLSDLQYGDVPFIEARAEAEQQLETAFGLEPNLASAFATRGFLLSNDGDQMEALSNFHRAIAADPNNAYAHFMISEVLANTGYFNDSLKELEFAYQLDSHHPIIQYRLVQYYLAAGNLSGLKRIVRPDQALLTEALIDFRFGREAAGVQKATEYLQIEESGFAGIHLRMELARRYYYRLGNLNLAQQTISETSAFAGRVYFQAVDYPEVAYQILRRIPEGYHNRFSRYLLARGQIRTGRYQGCLESLNFTTVAETSIQGSIALGLPGNDLTLAYFQAFCLAKLDRLEEAEALRQELVRYHQLAISQGEPPLYFRQLARLEMLAGNYEAALDLLEQAQANFALDRQDIANPWYDEVRNTDRFQALQASMYTHINEQRKILGWQPLDIPES